MMDWFEIESPDLPPWQRSAGIGADGAVYVPACLAGQEGLVLLLALHDGMPIIFHLEHAFVPSIWLASACPPVKDLCEEIERRLREEVSN